MQDDFVEAGVLIPYTRSDSAKLGYAEDKPVIGYLEKLVYEKVKNNVFDLNSVRLVWYTKINNKMQMSFSYNRKKVITIEEAAEEYPHILL